MSSSRTYLRNANIALIALAVVVLFSGCGDSGSKGSQEKVTDATGGTKDGRITDEPPPVQLLGGADTGIRVKRPTVVIARTSAQQKSLYKKHLSHGVKGDEPAGTDLNARQIVGVFVPKQKAGTQLVITAVNEDTVKHRVRVQVIVMPPGEGCKTKGIPPYPFQVVETRKMEGPGYIELTRQRQSPCN